jgi:chorismate mutase
MSDLDVIRNDIDCIDEQILQLLSKRQSKISEIAQLKSKNNLSARQPARHGSVMRDRQVRGKQYKLNPAMVNSIWRAIMSEAVRIQEEILNDKAK